MTSPSDPDLAIAVPVPLGAVVAGKYRVESLLGGGGMGVVAQGTHLLLGQPIAIKFLKSGSNSDPEALARFAREARASASIQSEHVVRILDVDALPDGTPYMVMEYLDGLDLAQLLREKGRLPVSEAVDYLLQAAEALAEAHRIGIVHRDLKPSNLLVTARADGSSLVKVLDFGISKYREGVGELSHGSQGSHGELTTTDKIMGSPSYMSPEQLRAARDVDARADVWAFGAVLYKLVVGKNPFRAKTSADLCVQILLEPPAKPDDDVELPEGLLAVIDKCLEKDVDRRYADLGCVAEALRPFCAPEAQLSIQRIVRTLAASDVARPPSSRRFFDADQPTADAPRTKSLSVSDPTPSVGTVGPSVHSGRQSLAPRPKRPLVLGLLAATVVGIVVWALMRSAAPPLTPAAGTAVPPPVVDAEIQPARVEPSAALSPSAMPDIADAARAVASASASTLGIPKPPPVVKRPGGPGSPSASGEFSGFGERK